MLVIRDEQLQALSGAARRDPLAPLRSHAREQFTDLLAGIDDERLDRFLSRVVAEAKTFELESVRDLLLFVNLSLVYGEQFLARRELQWMREMLTDPECSSASERLRLMYGAATRRATAS